MVEIEQHRKQFLGLATKVYFNFGGQGTMPTAALEALIDAHKYIQQQGPFSLKVNAWLGQRTALTRTAIAHELGVTPETIAFTENVTQGCNIGLWGIDWHKGDHILMTDAEHPGIIAIVKEICRRFQVEYSTCSIVATLNNGDPVSVIQQHLQPNTRLVVLSHILWNTGQVLPLAKIIQICHNHCLGEKPVLVLVDAAQSVGCLPLNLSELEVDFYAFTGHKWLCGPQGVGGLYIRPEILPTIAPTFIGWRGINIDPTGQPIGWKAGGERFEVATSAFATYEGLRAAIATHREWGTASERYEQICELSKYLWENLSRIEGVKCLKTSPPQSGLVSFQVTQKMSNQEMVKALEQDGFLLRSLANPDCVRACVHYFTLKEEIEQLALVIKKLIN